MFNDDGDIFLGGHSNIYVQYATVETPGWEKLGRDERIKISCTDKDSKFGESMPIAVEVFQKTFFPVADGVFQKRVKAALPEEDDGLVEITVLDQKGNETDKKQHINKKTFLEHFLPEDHQPI